MRATFVVGVSICLLAGCATMPPIAHEQVAFALSDANDAPSVRVSAASVLDSKTNPLAPTTLVAVDGEVEVTFGTATHQGRRVRLDPESLAPRSREPSVAPPAIPAPNVRTRIVMADGRSIVCFVEGDVEWGHRAMAQSFDVDGFPRGAAVPLSPPDADVLGALHAVSVDGKRVIATFPVTRGGAFDLVAVSVVSL
jgi:hypothetical protein